MDATIGPFRLIARHGSGGMGDVFAGEHIVTGAPIALKTIRARRVASSTHDATRAFDLEVEAVARIRHPGIVRVLDRGTIQETMRVEDAVIEAGLPFIIMDRIDGAPLRHEKMGWPAARLLLMRVLDALASAHARGVIHRDIKPENILIRAEDQEPVLIDFGIARLRGSDFGVSGGTPAYMAPEQLAEYGFGEGPWTDLYAVGCLAYELFTGRFPFLGATHQELIQAKLTGAPAPLPEHLRDVRLVTWLERLLALDPRVRFECAAAARCALAEIDAPVASEVSDLEEISEQHDSLFELSTFFSTSSIERRPAPAASDAPGAFARSRLPLPSDWRIDLTSETGDQEPMQGAGLGVFELRAIPMMGREPERDQLWSQLIARGELGSPRCVALSGFAGLGKSVLARWLCQRAHEVSGTPHIWITLDPLREVIHSVASALEEYLSLDAGADRDAVRARIQHRVTEEERHVGALTEFLRPSGQAGASWAHTARVLARTLEIISEEGPIILVLDDADLFAASEDILTAILELDAPILVLCTARTERLRRDEARRACFMALLSARDTLHIELSPLEERAHASLVARALHLDQEESLALLQMTRGNPLHTLQLLGSWIARGVVVPGERGFRRADASESLPLPESIELVCTQRVENVEQTVKGARLILEEAALLGQSLSWKEWDLLREVRPMSASGDLLLDAFVSNGLAERQRDGWRFVHGLVRENLERLVREDARWHEAHHNCYRVISRLGTDTCSVWRRASHHALEAHHWLEATDAFYRSQFDIPTHVSAERFELLVARIPKPFSPGVEANLEISRGSRYSGSGNFEEANASYERALELAERHDLLEPRVRSLACLMELAVWAGDVKLGFERAERVTALIDELEDDAPFELTRLGVMGQLAELHNQIGQSEEAIKICAEAIAISAGRYAWNDGWLYYIRASAHEGLGDAEACLQDLERAEAHFIDQGDLVGLASSQNTRGTIHYMRGDVSAALATFQQALEAYAEIGDAGYHITRENVARMLAELGSLASARQHIEGLHRAIDSGDAYETFIQDIDLLLAADAADWREFDALMDGFARDLEPEEWCHDYIGVGLLLTARRLAEIDQRARGARVIALLDTLIKAVDDTGILDMEELARMRAEFAH